MYKQVFRSGVGNHSAVNFRALYSNASDSGIDLLRQLLVIEPEKRISAGKALRHDFVAEFSIESETENDVVMEDQTEKFDFGFESEVN